jgi:hypothetical protein
MSGEVVHFEIPTDNAERARKFYSLAFGWKMQHMPEFEYTMVGTSPSDEEGMPKSPGMINGGMGARHDPLVHPTITINVEEINDAEKAIVKHGGTIVVKKQPIGDGSMGFTAYFKDTEGNIIGLYQRGKS